jgi:hypothetical protein
MPAGKATASHQRTVVQINKPDCEEIIIRVDTSQAGNLVSGNVLS